MHVHSWVRLDCHELERLRRYHCDVHGGRMWCGQRMRGRRSAARYLFLQPWVRLFVDNHHRVRGCHRHMRHVWGRLELCWERRPGGRVFLLGWVCLDRDELRRLCHNFFNLLDKRLRRGQRVCGRRSAASYLFMQPWLFVFVDDVQRMRRCHRHVRRLWGRLELRREWRPSRCVHVLSRLCVYCDELKRLRRYNRDMRDEWLRRGQRVCWRNSAACHLQLQPWLLLFVDNHHRLHGNHELLHRVWRRLQLRW